MSRGRPKKSIKTKRIQAVLPEEILFQLDKKVDGDKNLDRSKALTEAVNQWLGLTKKKRSFENIYKKFFGNSVGKDVELKPFAVLKKKNLQEETIIKIILGKLFENKTLTPEETKEINDYLSGIKISVNSFLRLDFKSKEILEVFGKLYLNTVFPINDYIGHCKYCGKEFFKRKKSQKYDTPVCKIHYLEDIKNKTNDPNEYKRLIEQIGINKQNFKIDVNSFYNINYESTFERIKGFIESLCFKADYKYSRFKKLFLKYLNDEYELKGFGNILYIYLSHIVKNYSYLDIEKLEYEKFGDFFAEELFPDVKDIRLDASKDIKELVSEECFAKRKVFLLLTYKILELPINFFSQEWTDFINLDISKFISNLFYNKKISKELKKDLIKVGNILKAVGCKNFHTDKTIEICKNMIKENEDDIETIALLIDSFVNARKFKEVIFYYNKLKEIEKRNNKVLVTDNSPFANLLPSIPYLDFINLRHIEVYSAFAATFEGNYELSANILNGEIIKNLRKLKEQGKKILDIDLYYPKQDSFWIFITRTLNQFALSKDVNLIKKANEMKEAYLNDDIDKIFEELSVVVKDNPEFRNNIFPK